LSFIIITSILIVSLLLLKGIRDRRKTGLRYPEPSNRDRVNPPYPELKLAVISDTHYYNRSLGDSGPAFEAYMLTDRKLLKESVELIELAIDEILRSDADVVLIPGDLTCEGELISHLNMAQALSRLRVNGRRVFIVPGNHDINMVHGAVSYKETETEPTESVSAEEFAEIYRNYGYKDALFRDERSLSYVAVLHKNLWLLAIDTCRYEENTTELDHVGSKASQSLIDWLAMILEKAAVQKIAVMAMIHHGVIEHWNGQGKLHPDYLVEDYPNFNRFLASYGVRLAFTGHYHGQDIALADYGQAGFIYDIETGSLVTPPCPMRFCHIQNNIIRISSVNLIDNLGPGSAFSEEANAFMLKSLEYEIINTLRNYLVSDRDSALLANYIALAFVAHSLGNEDPSRKPQFNPKELSLWGRFIYSRQTKMIDNLWTNNPPEDLNVSLDLSTRQTQ
jgi:calcineurin-like phosphoesterase family protein